MSYSGGFHQGKRHGLGTCFFANGETYKGGDAEITVSVTGTVSHVMARCATFRNWGPSRNFLVDNRSARNRTNFTKETQANVDVMVIWQGFCWG